MTDNTKMVDLPWHDGTTRTVPEGTVYVGEAGIACVALDGGYSFSLNPKSAHSKGVLPHVASSAAVRIFTEAPEPPVKINVPTGIGAIVSMARCPDKPIFVLGREGWRGVSSGRTYEASLIANETRNGARVLFEGVDE